MLSAPSSTEMRLCYPLTTPDAGVRIMGLYGPYEESFALLAKIGYEGAELMVRRPAPELADETKRLCGKYGIKIAAVGLTPAVKADKLFISSPDPEVRAAALERAGEVIRFASELGAPFCIGSFRGRVSEEADSLLDAEKAFRRISEQCTAAGIPFLVEPQGASNSNYMNDLEQAQRFKKEAGIGNMKFIFDMFHAQINEPLLFASIVKNAVDFGLVHCSGEKRLAPGDGAMPCREIIGTLAACGYDGWYSTEIKQEPDQETAARRAFDFLNNVKQETGR